MKPSANFSTFKNAMPFWSSLLLVPIIVFSTVMGGLWLALPPLCTWTLFAVLDGIFGKDEENPASDAPDDELYYYRLITLIWFPVQLVLLIWMLAYVPDATHLSVFGKFMTFFSMGIVSGTIGINYSHELMHQTNRLERWLADLLLASVLYGHFRTEHLLVHHRYVGTPRDAVTARYNEGFHRFFVRVIPESFTSALSAEKAMLERKGLPAIHRSNPFWRYAALQCAFLVLALWVGGLFGLALFAFQSLTAIWQLELIDYVEHYGLTREHLGDGKYEHVKPHHSWNAPFRVSNWLLINLQRHSDHHYKPNRRFPLLQSYDIGEAPQLPQGYPVMSVLAMVPPLWRRVMNPRVRAWRREHYPHIEDWNAYKTASNPLPR
ncbi:MAG: alkane 1-monooxygenase [Paracoccaceae bacterium]|nr:alkane 1-monooxygenase [Paracoccaceae bacterium]